MQKVLLLLHYRWIFLNKVYRRLPYEHLAHKTSLQTIGDMSMTLLAFWYWNYNYVYVLRSEQALVLFGA